MAEPTITQVFGAGATQSETTITISKADLAGVGLTVLSGNTAESLLAAIALKAKEYLTPANFEANIDQSVTIDNGFNSIITRTLGNGTQGEYRQFQLNFNFHKLDSQTLDPDDL